MDPEQFDPEARQRFDAGESVPVHGLYIETHVDGRRDLVAPNLDLRLKNFKVDSCNFGLTNGRRVIAKSWKGTAEPLEGEPT